MGNPTEVKWEGKSRPPSLSGTYSSRKTAADKSTVSRRRQGHAAARAEHRAPRAPAQLMQTRHPEQAAVGLGVPCTPAQPPRTSLASQRKSTASSWKSPVPVLASGGGAAEEPSTSFPRAAALPPAALSHPYVWHSPPHTPSAITSALAPLCEADLTPNPSRPSPERCVFRKERAKAAWQLLVRLRHVANTRKHPELRRAANPGPAPAKTGVKWAVGQPCRDPATRRPSTHHDCAGLRRAEQQRAPAPGAASSLSAPLPSPHADRARDGAEASTAGQRGGPWVSPPSAPAKAGEEAARGERPQPRFLGFRESRVRC